MKKIISVIGARPQFIKHAPMQLELQKHFNSITLHTGQHYDKNMSAVFFDELNMLPPDYLFDIGGSKRQGEQTGIMMTAIEDVCAQEKPDALLTYGDTNSTLATALIAAKMHIPLIHIEAGLRSFNRQMPEEINRIIADEFSHLLFCPTRQAVANLAKEGIEHERIFICGDVMVDTLSLVRDKISRKISTPYYFATLHRPYNTDDHRRLKSLLDNFQSLDHEVVFAVHPRTVFMLRNSAIDLESYNNIEFIDPIGYIDSVSYQAFAEAVITDSGGMQKEAYILRKKCVTLRSETEWIETLQHGWNQLVYDNLAELRIALHREPGKYIENLYGNGRAAQEIVNIIKDNI
ncbi:non-hydrolyzing UDP-N-acetylglucosamine 2-epimerase [Parapedobacter indicus]|uniref:UDP-GlcNAc3NAcA epimerase n=1 Tax=Parapedobacter indicus TaxID=1477437 RepID=A0A1I3TCN1_9SPHI|nr:UDP-N-acetylglucosamine 2-epimerase (non-hydrolyzing) [Parapedobacter indicus]PPK99539.1 UDP-GlcNAc3NAcA epimerase [Parapedobacter indicus]SFJ68715.1 UDP-GlcNAc3NAcA epimerase [Parapedobacter indicus]